MLGIENCANMIVGPYLCQVTTGWQLAVPATVITAPSHRASLARGAEQPNEESSSTEEAM